MFRDPCVETLILSSSNVSNSFALLPYFGTENMQLWSANQMHGYQNAHTSQHRDIYLPSHFAQLEWVAQFDVQPSSHFETAFHCIWLTAHRVVGNPIWWSSLNKIKYRALQNDAVSIEPHPFACTSFGSIWASSGDLRFRILVWCASQRIKPGHVGPPLSENMEHPERRNFWTYSHSSSQSRRQVTHAKFERRHFWPQPRKVSDWELSDNYVERTF